MQCSRCGLAWPPKREASDPLPIGRKTARVERREAGKNKGSRGQREASERLARDKRETQSFPLPTSHFPFPTSHYPLPTMDFDIILSKNRGHPPTFCKNIEPSEAPIGGKPCFFAKICLLPKQNRLFAIFGDKFGRVGRILPHGHRSGPSHEGKPAF